MQHQSILAHLASLLTNQIENVATDALAHLLLEYQVTSDAFREYVAQSGIAIPEQITLKTQTTWQDGAIPDLVGLDNEGRYVLIVESKFWAPLTPNQPTTYIERLPFDKAAILLFIAPASRLSTLWEELMDRCDAYPANNLYQESTISQFRTYHLNQLHILALTSWESMLTMLQQKAQQAGDIYAAGDIWQLQSLCDRIETDAFKPVAEDEITSPTEMRINQFKGLVDELVIRLVESGIASTIGYRATPGPDYYKRYFSLNGLPKSDWCVEFNNAYSKQYPGTYIWLTALETPQSSSLLTESSVIYYRYNKCFLFPLKIPIGVEREVVLSGLMEQVIEVIKRLINQ